LAAQLRTPTDEQPSAWTAVVAWLADSLLPRSQVAVDRSEPLLFPGGVGNTHKDPAAFASLFHDVTTKLFDRLDDGVTFYPGHGKNSTIGTERPSLDEWRARGW
jgi:hypothetical protein